jgi:gluconolactonase
MPGKQRMGVGWPLLELFLAPGGRTATIILSLPFTHSFHSACEENHLMRSPALAITLLLAVTAATASAEEAQPKPIPGIGPAGPIQKLYGDFQFTEGPASDGQGNLYFTDIPAEKIYMASPEGKLSVFLENSKNINGLMLNKDGVLYGCEMQGRLVAIDPKTMKITVLSDGYEGNRYNAPNDLVIDKTGGVYFTDPHFRAPMPLPQKETAVYYRAADGKVTRLTTEPKAPNGVILSPDEKTLYVVPSLEKKMYKYEIKSPGELGKAQVFCELKQAQEGDDRGGDGLTIDAKGNLYITSGLGLQVFSPGGKLLGIIPFPEQPSNATFGGKDNKTLYVTARTGLYACEMEVPGHVFAK